MTDDLRGLTFAEGVAVGYVEEALRQAKDDGALACFRTIRAALSRVPVAGEAVAPVAWTVQIPGVDSAHCRIVLGRPTDAERDSMERAGYRIVYLYAAPPSPPVAKNEGERMLAVCAALGFDPTNHHNADRCPYCTPPADGARDAARLLDEWHEDFGPVVWWKFPVDEPAWIGTPTDDDWPGYHTHWTPHPTVPAAMTADQAKGRT
jgi:hypothetical protein